MSKPVIKPDYYDNFHCIADKCQFTCCQEWKIAVDDDTYENWIRTEKEQLEAGVLTGSVCYKDDQRVIKLNEHMKCPHLNEDGLCKLVLKYGEEFISDTCHTFPREEHEYDDHVEQNLVLCCPYVIDLINQSDRFGFNVCFDSKDEIYNLRMDVIKHFQDDSIEATLEERMLVVYYIMLDALENGEYKNSQWEITGDLLKTIRGFGDNTTDNLDECTELFLDLTDNYMKEGLYQKLLKPLVNLAENEERSPEKYREFLNIWKKHQKLLIKLMSLEMYGDLQLPDSDMENVVVKFQWLVMEYVLFRHMCYLHFLDKGSIGYEDIRTYVVLAGRIMGYDEDDIYEYMENSFEELIWDFGYTSLILV